VSAADPVHDALMTVTPQPGAPGRKARGYFDPTTVEITWKG